MFSVSQELSPINNLVVHSFFKICISSYIKEHSQVQQFGEHVTRVYKDRNNKLRTSINGIGPGRFTFTIFTNFIKLRPHIAICVLIRLTQWSLHKKISRILA
jgi:hypothetical protein